MTEIPSQPGNQPAEQPPLEVPEPTTTENPVSESKPVEEEEGAEVSNVVTTANIPNKDETTVADDPPVEITINISDDKETTTDGGGTEANHGAKRYSDYSDDASYNDNKELYLSDEQKAYFRNKLLEMGKDVPEDEHGMPIFTKNFVNSLPRKIAHEINVAAMDNDDRHSISGSEYSSYGSETEVSRKSHLTEGKKSVSTHAPDSVIGVKYSPSGVGFLVDLNGETIAYEDAAKHLENAFTPHDLHKQDEINLENNATLLSIIRKEMREEEKNASLKKADSILELKEMALRYVPEVNVRPKKTDPMHLFEHKSTAAATSKGVVFPPRMSLKKEIVHLMDPKDFLVGRMDSLATVASTVERKLSNATVRGSLLSTNLSEFPSTYSQVLVDEPSVAIMSSTDQVFDITPSAAEEFRERWLVNFMKGYTPKNTFVIGIINLITRFTVELRVNKENTLNEVFYMYLQYDDEPSKYVWKDVYGNVLHPRKTLVQNGMVGQDEKVEFEGHRKLPTILLHFKDGFEDEPPLPLNPIFAMKQKEPGTCRNY